MARSRAALSGPEFVALLDPHVKGLRWLTYGECPKKSKTSPKDIKPHRDLFQALYRACNEKLCFRKLDLEKAFTLLANSPERSGWFKAPDHKEDWIATMARRMMVASRHLQRGVARGSTWACDLLGIEQERRAKPPEAVAAAAGSKRVLAVSDEDSQEDEEEPADDDAAPLLRVGAADVPEQEEEETTLHPPAHYFGWDAELQQAWRRRPNPTHAFPGPKREYSTRLVANPETPLAGVVAHFRDGATHVLAELLCEDYLRLQNAPKGARAAAAAAASAAAAPQPPEEPADVARKPAPDDGAAAEEKGPAARASKGVFFEGTDKEKRLVVVKERADRTPLVSLLVAKRQVTQVCVRWFPEADPATAAKILVPIAQKLVEGTLEVTDVTAERDRLLHEAGIKKGGAPAVAKRPAAAGEPAPAQAPPAPAAAAATPPAKKLGRRASSPGWSASYMADIPASLSEMMDQQMASISGDLTP